MARDGTEHRRSAADWVRQFALARNAPETAIESLAALGEVITFSAGTVLFSEGDRHDSLYLICGGSVSLEMVTAQCGRQRILTVGPGDLVAWSALVGSGQMTATAWTMEASPMLVFSGTELRRRCEADHEFGYAVMSWVARAMGRRLLATRLQLLDLFQA